MIIIIKILIIIMIIIKNKNTNNKNSDKLKIPHFMDKTKYHTGAAFRHQIVLVKNLTTY
jgi:hypothetical protein